MKSMIFRRLYPSVPGCEVVGEGFSGEKVRAGEAVVPEAEAEIRPILAPEFLVLFRLLC